MKRLLEVDTELDLINKRLDEIKAMPEPEGDEAVRSTALAERDTETDDLISRWDALQAERQPLLVRAQKLEDVAAAAKDLTRLEPGDGQRYLGRSGPGYAKAVDPFEGDIARLSKTEVVERARRVIEGEKRVFVSDASRARLDQWVQRSVDDDNEDNTQFDGTYIGRRMLLTENAMYRSAFRKYVAGAPVYSMAPDEQRALSNFQQFEQREVRRAMSENTGSAGGVGVPVLIDPSIIITSAAADVPLLRVCRIENVTNNLWQGVSSAGMVWAYSTEGTEASDNSPTLAQPTVRVHMPKGFLPYSVEVSMDYPGFVNEMGRLMDSGYNDLLANKTMNGTGTNEPFGLFQAMATTANSTDEVTPTTDGSFGGADIFKIWNALPERYRGNATWVMSVSVQSAIRQFASAASSTSAYFSIDLTGGTFRINDRPVIITDYAPTFSGAVPGTTGLQNILAVGDWNQGYLWVNRAGMSVEQIPILFGGSNRFPTGQRGLWAWARNGGNIINNNAGRLLQNQ